MKPILVTNIVAMVIFSMAVCFTKDIVTSKVRDDGGGRGALKIVSTFFFAYGQNSVCINMQHGARLL